MGTSRGFGEFAPKIGRAGRALSDVDRQATITSAKVVAELIDAERVRAGATSFAGRPVGNYRVNPRAKDKVLIRPSRVGAVVAHNTGTSPHIIGARRLGTRSKFKRRASDIAAVAAFQLPGSRDNRGAVGRVRNANGKLALSWAGVAHPTPYAFVSGMAGKHFVSRVMRPGGPGPEAGARTYNLSVKLEMSRVFR